MAGGPGLHWRCTSRREPWVGAGPINEGEETVVAVVVVVLFH